MKQTTELKFTTISRITIIPFTPTTLIFTKWVFNITTLGHMPPTNTKSEIKWPISFICSQKLTIKQTSPHQIPKTDRYLWQIVRFLPKTKLKIHTFVFMRLIATKCWIIAIWHRPSICIPKCRFKPIKWLRRDRPSTILVIINIVSTEFASLSHASCWHLQQTNTTKITLRWAVIIKNRLCSAYSSRNDP